jgi:2-C-methyl-D-erythritol 2,4-cyclodiphosphate synthase
MNRVGIGFDAHRLVPGRRLVLAGVEIDSKLGLAGHSDADVLCHALMDALLGAVAAGDIGQHFPDSDAEWKDADSMELLSDVVDIVASYHARPVNVDATVIAEKPRLAAYIPLMRQRLAERLDLTADRVSVKATTVEKMGALGRGEGIAVLAVATVASVESQDG